MLAENRELKSALEESTDAVAGLQEQLAQLRVGGFVDGRAGEVFNLAGAERAAWAALQRQHSTAPSAAQLPWLATANAAPCL